MRFKLVLTLLGLGAAAFALVLTGGRGTSDLSAVGDSGGGFGGRAQAAVLAPLQDADGDTVPDGDDNCPGDFNPGQENFDGDGPPFGDGVGIGNGVTVPGDDATVPNSDTAGDACDADDDNDGTADGSDANPRGDNTYDDNGDGTWKGAGDDGPSWDADANSVRDGVTCTASPAVDTDGDGLMDRWEQCKWGTDLNVQDTDGDGSSDSCEVLDVDGNGFVNDADLTLYQNAALLPAAAFGKDGDFDINGNGVIDFAGDALIAAKLILLPLSPVSCPGVFPPGPGDDVMPSLGIFRITVHPDFRPLMAGYPGYNAVTFQLQPPVTLFDPATVVGRSDVHVHGDASDTGGTPVGTAGTIISDSDFAALPPGFQGPAGTREVHTEILSMNLTGGGAVRAGVNAPQQPRSAGEVESKSGASGDPNLDFPAESFFDVYVEVDLPGLVSFPGGTLYNPQPLIVANEEINNPPGLPPRVVYLHENSSSVPVLFRDDNPPYWDRGDLFGNLVLAGHGANFDQAGPASPDQTTQSDQEIFEDFMAAQSEMPLCPTPDSDGDCLDDAYETAHSLCLDYQTADAENDPDSDGLSSLEEQALGTDPCDDDTDGDGYKDKPATSHADPNPDTNKDNCPLDNNPSQANSDGKPLGNGTGIPGEDATIPNTDPDGDDCDDDDDNDHIPDVLDAHQRGDVTSDDNADGTMLNLGDDGPSWDSDGNGVRDGLEGSCPLALNPNADDDADGLLNTWEVCRWGTAPNAQDSDGDGLKDCKEAADVNGDGVVDFIGDAIYYARAALLSAAAFGKDADFDINGDSVIDFVGDVIQEAKFALMSGLCQ